MVNQTVNHLLLLDAGIANSLIRLLSRALKEKDRKECSRYVNTGLFALVVIGFLILLAGVPLILLYFEPSKGSAGTSWESKWVLLIATVTVAISMPFRLGHGLLASIHRFDVYNALQTGAIVLRVGILGAAILVFKVGLLAFSILFFALMLTGLIVTSLIGFWLNGCCTVSPSLVSWGAAKHIYSLSAANACVTLASTVLNQAGLLLVGILAVPENVPIATYPVMIFLAFSPFLMASLQVLIPIVSRCDLDSDRQKIVSYISMYTKFHTICVSLVFTVFFLFGRDLLDFWLGSGLSNSDVLNVHRAALVILFGFGLAPIAQVGRTVLSSVGYHWISAKLELSTAGIAGCLFVFGLRQGLSPSLVIAGVIGSIWMLRGLILYPTALVRVVKCPFHVVLRGVLRVTFCQILVLLSVSFSSILDLTGPIRLSVSAGIIVFSAVILYLTILTADDKKRLRERIRLTGRSTRPSTESSGLD